MNKFQAVCGFLMIATVSACSSSNSNGGGGTGGGTTGGTVSLPVAPGAGTGAISASTLNTISASLVAMDAAILDGSIAAPTTAPTGQATLNGYVGIDGELETEAIIGNLTIAADFDAGTVNSTASDFGEFDFSDPANPVAVSTIGVTGGNLTGTGTINSTTMTSFLDGNVSTTAGDVAVLSTLNGGVYDNGGVLAIIGDVTATVGGFAVYGDFLVSE